jgi:diadenosine tetraphosphate (Ap4A) HIT family hydrolase
MSQHPNCPFCGEPKNILENELAVVHYDSFPVSAGHCLVTPRRHVAEYFEATAAEKAAIWELVDELQPIIDREFSPDGYNIGINIGAAAGQSIPHLHIHVIPRYAGDVENPQGGVRGVIPHKQKYVRKPRKTGSRKTGSRKTGSRKTGSE